MAENDRADTGAISTTSVAAADVTTAVLDAEQRMLGVVTVDDVLELLMPTGWRRDFGMSAPEE